LAFSQECDFSVSLSFCGSPPKTRPSTRQLTELIATFIDDDNDVVVVVVDDDDDS